MSKKDKSIGAMFDASYKGAPKPAIVDNFEITAKRHIELIMQHGAKSVLDIGMGTGGILLALQNLGVSRVYGIELSHNGIELAKKRFQQFGDPETVTFYEGSFLNFQSPPIDAISLHNVIHCYPDYESIVNKIIEISPEIVVNTMPKRTWYTRLFMFTISVFTRMFKGFRAYSHPTTKIDKIFVDNNYQRILIEKYGISETTVYIRKNDL